MPIRPHQASNDEGFGIRVTQVSLHRVADGPLSTRNGPTLNLANVGWAIAEGLLGLSSYDQTLFCPRKLLYQQGGG